MTFNRFEVVVVPFPFTDLAKSGLPAPSVVRMKLFTLDHRLVLSTSGVLSPEDQQAVRKTLSRLLHDA